MVPCARCGVHQPVSESILAEWPLLLLPCSPSTRLASDDRLSGHVDHLPARQLNAFSETHWKSLRYFNLYRLASSPALLFSVGAALSRQLFPSSVLNQGRAATAGARQCISADHRHSGRGCLPISHRQHATVQLTASVVVDVLVLTLLIHVGGGLGSGLGSMLLVTLAGAGLVGQGRLVVVLRGDGYPGGALRALLPSVSG
jgi:hypothetical protein